MIVTSKYTNQQHQKQLSNTNKSHEVLLQKIKQMLKYWKKCTSNSKQRILILKQWIKTQEDYNKDINIIINKIQKSMIQYQLITPQQDRILFPNLNTLLKLSYQMVNIVKNFVKNWNPHTTLIAQQLINFHKSFIVYRQYYNNFYQAQKIRQAIKKRPKYSQFTKIISSLPMDIESYTIKPVQRPPKYQLFLKQYKKVLSNNHKDYLLLIKAIQKYHQVNQQNNQSMDLQLRNYQLIQIDYQYGSIINSKRIYLFEEFVNCVNFNGKIYVFNDLILVVKISNSDKYQGYKKIFLNYQSFVNAPIDGKYFRNKLFICGIKQNIHVTFSTVQTRNRVYEKLQQIIHELYTKQSTKSQSQKQKRKKMKVMSISKIQIRNKPVFRVTVAGSQKRPSLLNLNYQPYYILKIQAPFPNHIFQYSMIKFGDLLQIQEYIRNNNKMLPIPILDDKPQNMGIFDVKKNKTKIIQCRYIYIQRFINFVLRSEELEQYSQLVAKTLKINQELWKLASYIQPCNCEICAETRQCVSFQELQQEKSIIRVSVMSDTNDNINHENARELYPRCSLTSLLSSVHCVFNNFMMQQKTLSAQISDLNTLQRRLDWLQCKSGRVDYTFLPKNKAQKSIKVIIQLLSLKEDENISINISRKSTVVEVLDDIAQIYKISTLRDFCLVLEYHNTTKILDRDQILWDILNDAQYQFTQQPKLNRSKSGSQTIINIINSMKKWSEQTIIKKKPKIFLKKYIFMQNELQIKACQLNPQRYFLIVQQIFYRFHNQNMILSLSQTKQLCALFYILNYMDRLPFLTTNNFQVDKLKNLLPKYLQYLLNNDNDGINFQKEVFWWIKEDEKKIQNITLDSIKRVNCGTKIISAKVQVIYNCILKLVAKNMSWSTLFFNVVNYKSGLPGGHQNLMLGVNKKCLMIINYQQMGPLVQIQLAKLNYRISVISIFIKIGEKQFRFDGQMIFTIKKMLDINEIISNKFGGG